MWFPESKVLPELLSLIVTWQIENNFSGWKLSMDYQVFAVKSKVRVLMGTFESVSKALERIKKLSKIYDCKFYIGDDIDFYQERQCYRCDRRFRLERSKDYTVHFDPPIGLLVDDACPYCKAQCITNGDYSRDYSKDSMLYPKEIFKRESYNGRTVTCRRRKCLQVFKINPDTTVYVATNFDTVKVRIECPHCKYRFWLEQLLPKLSA